MSEVVSLIEYLINQHREILLSLRHLEALRVKMYQKNIQFDAALFREDILNLDRQLKLHKQLEEETIFPLMATFTGYDGPASFVELEHKRIWELLESLKISVEGLDPILNADGFFESLTALDNLLQLHIEKENQVLFPQVEKYLKDHFHSQVVKDFQDRFAAKTG